MNYYYLDAVYNFYNNYGAYISYFLDTTVALDQQYYDEEGGQTWADYFLDEAIESAKGAYAVYDEAVANGYSLSEEGEQTLADNMDSLKTSVEEAGYPSLKSYLTSTYGRGSSESSFEQYQRVQLTASEYAQAYQDSLTYTADDLQAKYDEDPNQYTNVTYRSFYIAASNYKPEETEDETAEADASEAEAEEDNSEYLAMAEADAKAMAKAAKGDEAAFADQAYELATETAKESYEDPDYTLRSNASYSAVPSYCVDWLYDDARKEGDTTYVGDDGTGYYVLYFIATEDNNYNTVNVRHILLAPEQDLDSDEDGTMDASSDEALAAAKQEAEDVLAEWKAGEATEESFAALADTYSADSTEGGLLENIYHNQMVQPFNDWCFDESRQPGDVEIVQTEFGYHIIYFISQGDTYRDVLIRSDLRSADYESWYTEVTEACTAERHEDGMAYLNLSLVLSSGQ